MVFNLVTNFKSSQPLLFQFRTLAGQKMDQYTKISPICSNLDILVTRSIFHKKKGGKTGGAFVKSGALNKPFGKKKIKSIAKSINFLWSMDSGWFGDKMLNFVLRSLHGQRFYSDITLM